jgi:hypothetical protein
MNDAMHRVSLACLLRVTGAMTIVAALCAHLLGDWDGWNAWNDLSRYYAMLASAALMCGAGFALSYFGKDNKGARVFFGLGLLAVVANVTTLGGLLHSTVQWDDAASVYPEVANWTVDAGVSLATTVTSALIVLLPITWFAYKVLARPKANELAILFVGLCLLLLVPIRESLGVGLLITAAVASPLLYLHQRARSAVSLRTAEGRFAVATLFAPAVVMTARLLWLYQADTLLIWILTGIVFVGTRYVARMLHDGSPWHFVNGVCSLGFATVVAWLSAELTAPYLGDGLVASFCGLVLSALVYSMGYQHVKSRATFAIAGAVILAGFVSVNALFANDVWATAFGLAAGLAIIAVGYLDEHKLLIGVGATTAGLVALPEAVDLATAIDWTHWSSLAVLGAAVILLGSFVEQRSRRTSTK